MGQNTKQGARHSRKDQTKLQSAHDAMVELGAFCDMETDTDEGKAIEMADDSLLFDGGAVKALGNGKVGGYLVRFSDENNPDLEGEYFTAETDFGDAVRYATLYHHGMDLKIGRRRIGTVDVRVDDGVGLWVEGQLFQRDEYEKAILKLAEMGKLGWSSGAAAHTVERTKTNKATHITQWYIAEASLTPTPAEPRNAAISLKSYKALQTNDPNKAEAEVTTTVVTPQATVTASDATTVTLAEGAQALTEAQDMEKEQITMLEDIAAKATTTSSAVETLVARVDLMEKALKAESTQVTKATQSIVTDDPADRPFKNIAEQCQAVKNYTLSMGQTEHPRLKHPSLKAVTGASEGVPADGGFLLDPTLSAEFIKPIHEEGPFSSAVRTLPVGSNSNYGWLNGVDETSRVTGSRWGGIRGYRLAEGGTKTASRPTFRRINWELKKYAILVYGTDELLQDSAQFAAVVNQGCREELNFMVNDDIMNGAGLAGPQGFMNSGALVTVTRDTGSTVLHTDVAAMWNRMDPRGKAKATWYIHNEVQPKLDALYFTGSTSVLSPFIGYRPDGVMTMYGRPVVVTEFNQALNTSGDIALCDMSQYLFWEKGGVQEAASIHVAFVTDETVFRFVYRCDGQSSLASALTPYHGTTTTSPFVVLGSAT